MNRAKEKDLKAEVEGERGLKSSTGRPKVGHLAMNESSSLSFGGQSVRKEVGMIRRAIAGWWSLVVN